MPLQNKSLIIFDWDGTLMDSIGLIVEAMQYASKRQNIHITDEQVKSIIGLSLVDGIETLFKDYPQLHDALLKDYVDYYLKYCENEQLFDNIQQLIKTLHTQGKTLAVATGKKRAGLDRVFEPSGIAEYFALSRCADETASKPNPLMLQEILATTNQSVDNAVMIGDSIHDIRMAHAIGMVSVAVSYGCATAEILQAENPTFLVNSVAELAKLFGIDI